MHKLGRCTQTDPSGQLRNPYAYAACNPVAFSDPTGLSCGGAVFGLLLGAVGLALSAAEIVAGAVTLVGGVLGVIGFVVSATGVVLSVGDIVDQCG
jgi:hypothetical protein